MPRLIDRRRNKAQRAAVQRVISTCAGITSVVRTGDGSVFVYEDHSDWIPPTTLRTRISTTGEIGKPQRFHRALVP